MPTSYSTSTTLLDSLITPETLSDRLGVRLTTLAEWRVKGRGPAFLRVGRSPRAGRNIGTGSRSESSTGCCAGSCRQTGR